MNEIIVQQAHQRREKFLEIKNLSSFAIWQLAYQIWNHKDWKKLGFESMRDYFEAPINAGGLDTSRSYMIVLAESWDWALKSGLSLNQMKGLKPNKIYYLKKMGVKNYEDIKSYNENNSVKDLMLMSRNIEPETCNHPKEQVKTVYYCKRCKSFFNNRSD